MQTSFIYSASRTNTLSEELLTKTDIDRLLVASPGEELHTALKETYLAPYLLQVNESVPEAVDLQLQEAMKLVSNVAPRQLPLTLLSLQHDVHNLRLFAKAVAANLPYETLASHVSKRGVYEPAYLYERAQGQSLNGLERGWQEAYDEAVRSTQGDGASTDTIFDQLYFRTIEQKALETQDVFLKRYVKALIDLYNLKAQLRVLAYPQIAPGVAHISGGSFAASEIETKEQIMNAYQSLGGETLWRDAVEAYLETKNTTQLDARADDYLLSMTRESAYDMFSPASLVLYYLRAKQAAANIRTIIALRDGGMDKEQIIPNLRLAYVKD